MSFVIPGSSCFDNSDGIIQPGRTNAVKIKKGKYTGFHSMQKLLIALAITNIEARLKDVYSQKIL